MKIWKIILQTFCRHEWHKVPADNGRMVYFCRKCGKMEQKKC